MPATRSSVTRTRSPRPGATWCGPTRPSRATTAFPTSCSPTRCRPCWPTSRRRSKEGEDGASPDRSIARRRRGLRFGKLRGLAHYDAADLYREFRHLRHAIWRFLRQQLDWGRGDAFEVMLAIDQYLDEVIGASLRGYVEASERAAERESPDHTPD